MGITEKEKEKMHEILNDDFNEGVPSAPQTMVLFGATGDLSQRKLYSSLYNLYLDHRLPSRFALIGVSRKKLSHEEFRSLVQTSLEHYGKIPSAGQQDLDGFLKLFYYAKVDATNTDEFTGLKNVVEDLESKLNVKNRLFYLAMAPEFFATVALNLKASGLSNAPGWKRLVIEKPFGTDLTSAEELNQELREVFEEDEIYRIDHYLGKEMVQNIEVLRFANSIFRPVWNSDSIANVQITSSETVGVEERAGYYDQAGAIRDMLQNHMLQMVMMIAMEPPSRLKTEAIRDEKVKVLRSLRRYPVNEVAKYVVLGQYTKGHMNGKEVPGYREEHGVDPNSRTETFVAARLHIDNFRWAGVPFYIRTGKRLGVKATEIVIQFKDMPKHLYFNTDGNLLPNLLVIRVYPEEGIYVRLNAKRPGTDGTVVPVAMEFSQEPDNSPEAYERLIYDAMRGDSTFFTRWDEVALAWKFVDPILQASRNHYTIDVEPYEAGSFGPDEARRLLEEDDFRWWPVYGETTNSPAAETTPAWRTKGRVEG